MNLVKNTASSATRGISGATKSIVGVTKKASEFSISDLRKADVDVVEVREKDLKEMPLGKDRAIAFEEEKKKSRSFWSYVLPTDFKEPVLPDIDDNDMDSSLLLPPKPL